MVLWLKKIISTKYNCYKNVLLCTILLIVQLPDYMHGPINFVKNTHFRICPDNHVT